MLTEFKSYAKVFLSAENQPNKNMTINESSRSFYNAILAVLSTDKATWPSPVIYAENVEGDQYRFDSCNASAMPAHAILWLAVEDDSFGDLTNDHESDALGIEVNMFETAVNDVNDAFFFA